MHKTPYEAVGGDKLENWMGEWPGKWIEVGSAFPRVRCSECKTVFLWRVQEMDKCPVCGSANEKTEDYYD